MKHGKENVNLNICQNEKLTNPNYLILWFPFQYIEID